MMKPYMPDSLPLSGLDYQQLLPLIGQANAELARYDGLLQGIPNSAVMLSPLTTQEAVLSSKIEDTQATVDEVLEQEAGLVKEGAKYQDIREISNYRTALFRAREYLQDRPIRLGFVRELHRILLDSVRGQNKSPGEFRKDQNWIGISGCTIEAATFVPPNPLQLPDFLLEWEAYLGIEDIDALLQTAVVHAQFELLHPFKDGNGRIGRILIPLFLFQKKMISQPMFYLSEYLESHRDEYYSCLKAISDAGDWDGWIAFFLRATIGQAKQNSYRVTEIQNLYSDMKTKIQEITHSQYTVHLLDAIFDSPVFETTKLITKTGIQKQTAMGLLRQLKEAGVLKELRAGSGRRPAVLSFPRLLNTAEGKKIL
jgi:Fic family protein